ncbi:ubiquitin carboxyl-terminal hydrolase-domain-containing protein [Abortiporus biennis]|nr:ubiquitin carboxyl-terminal hydrolase-domain-containing protein [Abortiporus biennis]
MHSMSTTYHQTSPINPHGTVYPTPLTALAFDPLSDTLWTGSNSGSIVAYYSARGVRGVAFPIGGNLAVKDIVATDSNIRAFGVASDGIGAWSKGGVNKWFYRSSNAVTAVSNNAPNAPVFHACTAAQELLTLNAQTGDVVRKATAISIYTHLINTHSYLVSGSSDGYVRTHDSRTSSSTVNSTKAHLSGLQGLEAGGNFIFTIGMGTRQGRPYPDPLVKVYDIRTMRSLPPVPFSGGPAFINRLPNRSSTIVVTSNEGLVNVVDVSNPTDSEFYQLAPTSYITTTAVSPTGTYLAFGDADGVIQLLSAGEEGTELPLNGFEGQPVEWADPPEALPDITWTDSTPLNSIGMPYYNSPLLSSWTSKFVSSSLSYPPPPKIPPQILSTMKYNDNVAYATLPKELRGRRNVVQSEPRKSVARFRSGQSRFTQSDPDSPSFEYEPEEVPKIYRKVEIEYSKFGVEDFDFGFYNQTEFSGLETHIMNSYTNAIVQLLHYTQPIRQLAKSHITTDCNREHCLFCELGFVVRMLEDAKGTNCQSSNFCKTVGVLAHGFNLLELVDYGKENADLNYAHMIQTFHRFLVDQLSSAGDAQNQHIPGHPPKPNPWIYKGLAEANHFGSAAPSPITQLMGIDAKNIVTCVNCQAVKEKDNLTYVVDLMYPNRKQPTNDFKDGTDFPSILRNSLLRHTTHKGSCSMCNRQFATFDSKRSIASRDLPPILAINAAAFTEDNTKFWKDSRHDTFLKPTLELQGQVHGVDDPETVLYELRGLVVQIVPKEKGSHLVAIVKVPEAEHHADPEIDSPWYLFNDFSVREISEEEALSFPGSWKVPTILYYERVDIRSELDFNALPNEIDLSILSQDTNISRNRDPNLIKHQCLAYHELPTPGTLVAIDAEFVSMQQEETEFRSDGTKKVLRPARLSLARVSVLRGGGEKEGVPFIDDHIHTSELIVDYLTEFSGIKYGDLDLNMSRYTLTPLKVVYKKLRLLVDRGCIFIGHGLSKDFRIINIFVPPEQVIDTVDLYFLRARQRRLSLRFLAWFVLKENIQTDTHDSIEDALSALRLYKAYQEFEYEGTFDQKLEEIYREGKQYNFKPPPAPGAPQSATMSGTSTPQYGLPAHGNLIMPNFPAAAYSMPVLPNLFYAPSPGPFGQPNQWRPR